MQDLFPFGATHYVVGGLLIGGGIGAVYLMAGRLAGISGILTAAQSFWSRRAFFRRPAVLEERAWKGMLVLGLLVGAAIMALSAGEFYVSTVQPWRLALGGAFVGFGTRMARGCTSGHGICGISGASLPSLVSTVAFLGTAIVVAQLMASAGVTP